MHVNTRHIHINKERSQPEITIQTREPDVFLRTEIRNHYALVVVEFLAARGRSVVADGIRKLLAAGEALVAEAEDALRRGCLVVAAAPAPHVGRPAEIGLGPGGEGHGVEEGVGGRAAVDGVVDVGLAVVEGGEEALPVGGRDVGFVDRGVVHVVVCERVGAEGEEVDVAVLVANLARAALGVDREGGVVGKGAECGLGARVVRF